MGPTLLDTKAIVKMDNNIIEGLKLPLLLKGQGNQCSRLKPSHEFHYEGLSNLNPLVEGFIQIQDFDPRI